MLLKNPKRTITDSSAIALLFTLVFVFSFQARGDNWGSEPQPEQLSGMDIQADTPAPPPVSETYRDEGRNHMTPTTSEDEKPSCASQAKTAALACKFPGTAGMDSGNSMMFTMMMNQLVQTGAQMAAIGKDGSAQCKLQADVSKIMGSINGIKGATCGVMMSKCSSTCEEEAEVHRGRREVARSSNNATLAIDEMRLMSKAEKEATQCKSYGGDVAAMMTGAMQSGLNYVQNKQCQKDLAALAAIPAPTLAPRASIGDCSDPNNQTLACFCTRDANKSSAMCAGFGNGSLAGGGSSVVPNGSTVATPISGTLADGTNGNTTDPFGTGAAKKEGDGKAPGDGGTGAPGGGGISALSSEGGGGGAPGDPRSAITGTSGGTGSGLGGAGGGSGGGGGLARNNGAGGGKDGLFDKFNLKRFLPGSKYKTRGIAGMSVKSVDGITGPMGPSIWEKATRQYQEQIQKQNVILEK